MPIWIAVRSASRYFHSPIPMTGFRAKFVTCTSNGVSIQTAEENPIGALMLRVDLVSRPSSSKPAPFLRWLLRHNW